MFERQANNEEFLDFHKTIHWRQLKKIASKAMKMNHTNPEDYNLDKIRVYKATGLTFNSSNVSSNIKGDCSCFVDSNHYEFYEIPKKEKKLNFTGDFFILIYNSSFKFWLCGLMKHYIDEKKREKVKLKMFSQFVITYNENNKINFIIKASGRSLGFSDSKKRDFDTFGIRKRAYGFSKDERGIEKIRHKEKAVKIFKKEN